MKLVASIFFLAACSTFARGDDGCSASHHHGWWGNSANFAESREERLPNASVNYISPGQNGSIRVHGWSESGVLVKACVQTWADTDAEAKELARKVRTSNGAGHIEASGPHSSDHANWSVSYEVWMPKQSEAKLEASNGSIAVEDVLGRLRFHTMNGSVKMSDVGGTVEGDTTNGSIQVSVVEKTGASGGLRLETTNGSVRLELPENFSARVEASTVNGSIHTDFPATVSGDIGKHLQFTLGGGGSREIEAKTTNGSIHISRRA